MIDPWITGGTKTPAPYKTDLAALGKIDLLLVTHAHVDHVGDGFKIWHMGDTGLFGDMKFIADYYKPDLVLAPIGGNFTMGPEDAAYGIRNWINPRTGVIPIHYNSNPLARGTLAEFQAAMRGSTVRVVPMAEGETVEF